MRIRFDGLWKNADLLKFWTGETISLFGSQITVLALPLTAALTFQANPMQIGLLNAAKFAPNLVITLLAGVWIDRVRRRPIMIGANVGQAVLLGLIPLCWSLGLLRMEHLYVITFLTGFLDQPLSAPWCSHAGLLCCSLSQEVLSTSWFRCWFSRSFSVEQAWSFPTSTL
jgi:MFS family permease